MGITACKHPPKRKIKHITFFFTVFLLGLTALLPDSAQATPLSATEATELGVEGAVSSWMPVAYNKDGSLDLYIQRESPGKDKEANWLPAAAAEFSVTMRMYWPKDKPPSILDGSWQPPDIKLVN